MSGGSDRSGVRLRFVMIGGSGCFDGSCLFMRRRCLQPVQRLRSPAALRSATLRIEVPVVNMMASASMAPAITLPPA